VGTVSEWGRGGVEKVIIDIEMIPSFVWCCLSIGMYINFQNNIPNYGSLNLKHNIVFILLTLFVCTLWESMWKIQFV
jgi:hypothetical protein